MATIIGNAEYILVLTDRNVHVEGAYINYGAVIFGRFQMGFVRFVCTCTEYWEVTFVTTDQAIL